MMTWREKASPIIHKIIKETGTEDMKLLRKKLRDTYPWGERKMHPYKIWCDEINKQLGNTHTQRKQLEIFRKLWGLK